MTTETTTVAPVKKSVVVKASVEHAFKIFTEGFDSWWPREHHIGSAPMQRAIIEGKVGGRCYSHQVDGTDCPWGTVTAWEPPHRFVFAWQITPQWAYQPDMSRSSEVEVRFTPEPGGATRVDLEHRNFHRHGDGALAMRNGVDAEKGWGFLLTLFATAAER